MSIVALLSGGLDSCLMSVLAKEIGREQIPIFINYGQLNAEKEYEGAKQHCKRFDLATPVRIEIPNYGRTITSGITDSRKHIVDDAFLPGRNLLLLLIASSFAFQNNCTAVSLGLLDESTALFSDQTDDFLISAEYTISKALGRKIEIIAPLRGFRKSDVVAMAKSRGIEGTYSCHAGGMAPCGNCISCKEFQF